MPGAACALLTASEHGRCAAEKCADTIPRTVPSLARSGVEITASAPASIMTFCEGCPAKISLVVTSCTITCVFDRIAAAQAKPSSLISAKNVRNVSSKACCAAITSVTGIARVPSLGARERLGHYASAATGECVSKESRPRAAFGSGRIGTRPGRAHLRRSELLGERGRRLRLRHGIPMSARAS